MKKDIVNETFQKHLKLLHEHLNINEAYGDAAHLDFAMRDRGERPDYDPDGYTGIRQPSSYRSPKTIDKYAKEVGWDDSMTRSYIKWLNSLRNYCTSSEILKYGDYSIELLEDYPCLNRYELNYREGYYQLLNFLNCVNTVISGGKKYRCQNLDNTEKHHMCYCGRIILNNLLPCPVPALEHNLCIYRNPPYVL